MQSIPNPVLIDEVISKLDLPDIYAYCQGHRGISRINRFCQSGSFWCKVGTKRYPELSRLLVDRNFESDLGRIYFTLAKAMYHLNQRLDEVDYVSIETEKVSLNQAQVEHKIRHNLSLWWEDDQEYDLYETISRLHNGRYSIVSESDKGYITMMETRSPDDFVERLLLLFLFSGTSPSPDRPIDGFEQLQNLIQSKLT